MGYQKIIVLLVLVVGVFSCKSSLGESTKTVTITSGEIKEMVTFLASDKLQGRNTGSEGIQEAANYIETHFKNLGVKPYFETYRDTFDVVDIQLDEEGNKKESTIKAFNIVGYIEGVDSKLKNEIILLGAHYDHIGSIKVDEGDSIANGANDNATGTSTVLALSKYFSIKKSNKRSLMFVLFSAEEKGLLGSKHLSSLLREKGDFNLYTMLNFEMIGVPMKDKPFTAYLTGYGLSNMAEKLNEYANSELVGFLPKAKTFNLFKRSDNYPFHNAFSVACQTLSTFDFTNYEYYHDVRDEAQLMDYSFMANTINQIIPAIEGMSNTAKKEIYNYGE